MKYFFYIFKIDINAVDNPARNILLYEHDEFIVFVKLRNRKNVETTLENISLYTIYSWTC